MACHGGRTGFQQHSGLDSGQQSGTKINSALNAEGSCQSTRRGFVSVSLAGSLGEGLSAADAMHDYC